MAGGAMIAFALAGLLIISCGLRYDLRRYRVMRRWRDRHGPT